MIFIQNPKKSYKQIGKNLKPPKSRFLIKNREREAMLTSGGARLWGDASAIDGEL